MSSAALSIEPLEKKGVEADKLWSQHLRILSLTIAVILLLFWRDGSAMVQTWWGISTYNHCLLIVPILFWLVHQRASELRKIAPAIWTPGLIWVGAAAFGWLLGEAAGIALARQLGLVMMLQGAVMMLLGRKIATALVFPLCYSFFLVPFGEEIVPALQTITAKMAMVLLGWANIPAFIDGIFISTPTGYFEVAEACSGIKFLIAMIAYGVLVSNICFKSWSRRMVFMIAAILVPVVANGIRAFGTIYIAHHTTTDFASGFDHIFYGWFFFAFVLALVMAIGWPFFDRKVDDPIIDGEYIQKAEPMHSTAFSARNAGILVVAIVAAPMIWAAVLAARDSSVPEKIVMPQVSGWQQVDYQPQFDWQPRFDGASHRLLGRYQNITTGDQVDLAIAVFDRQGEGRELVGFGQGAFDPDTAWSWNKSLPGPDDGSTIQIIAPGQVVRDVTSFYRIGGIVTGSGAAVKLATVKTKLLGGDQQAVAVLVSSENGDDNSRVAAKESFLKALGPVDKLADEMAGLR